MERPGTPLPLCCQHWPHLPAVSTGPSGKRKRPYLSHFLFSPTSTHPRFITHVAPAQSWFLEPSGPSKQRVGFRLLAQAREQLSSQGEPSVAASETPTRTHPLLTLDPAFLCNPLSSRSAPSGRPAGLAGPVPSLCPNVPPGSASPGMWKWPCLLKRETYRRRGRGANKPALSRCPLSPRWPAFPPASLDATGLPITPESQVGRGQPSTEALGRHSPLACREQRFSHWFVLRGGQSGQGEPEATRWPPLWSLTMGTAGRLGFRAWEG